MQTHFIEQKIFEMRGQKVMLVPMAIGIDLAELYEVETRVLNQSVKRNIERSPKDFMFRLTKKEWNFMSSQIVMTLPAKRPKTALPYVFTEHGVTMLASILRSDTAVKMDIAIVRTFIALRKFAIQYKDILEQLNGLREKIGSHDTQLNQHMTH